MMSLVFPTKANAVSVISSTAAFAVYVDAPYVQGSYIAATYPKQSATETFDSITTDLSDCPDLSPVGSISGGDCKVIQGNHAGFYPYGGAITTSSQALVGDTASVQSPSAAVYTSNGETIVFNSPKNYVGFWWSAGSISNNISFYQGNNLLLTLTADDVYTSLPNDSSTLTALDGITQYATSNYYGHPINPTTYDSTEPFVYFHVFSQNGVTFDKIKISTSGNGFEDRKSTRLNSSHIPLSRMPSSA